MRQALRAPPAHAHDLAVNPAHLPGETRIESDGSNVDKKMPAPEGGNIPKGGASTTPSAKPAPIRALLNFREHAQHTDAQRDSTSYKCTVTLTVQHSRGNSRENALPASVSQTTEAVIFWHPRSEE